MQLSGAQMIIKTLEDLGVERVFGLPGGVVIPLYDALYDSKIEHVLVRHEQGAVHGAEGYARITGKAGVCFATSGPGATNLVTGIADAYLDSVPLVVITGQVASSMIGSDAFQEADILGITLPIVKHSSQIKSAQEIPAAIVGAFHIASTGRNGPVLIDVPVDCQKQFAEYVFPTEVRFQGYHPDAGRNVDALSTAVELIKGAKKPVLLAGGGVTRGQASGALRALADKYQIPVITSLQGKGTYPESAPLSLGMGGMHGTPYANRALIETDLVIAVGTRFSDRSTGKTGETGFAKGAKIIHIDRDPAEISKNVASEVWLTGEALELLELLNKALEGEHIAKWDAWAQECQKIKQEMAMTYPKDGKVHPQEVLSALYEVTGGKAIVTTEVGQNQMWSALHFKADNAGWFLSSGGLGTMGFGLPAAMGAAAAVKDLGLNVPVVCVAGDGSFMMNMQEIDTCTRYGLDIKILLLNNSCLGMVRQWQELFFNEHYSQTIYPMTPNYKGLVEAMGGHGMLVEDPAEIKGAIEKALSTPGVFLIDFKIPQSDKVFPMVPPGASIDKMILAKE